MSFGRPLMITSGGEHVSLPYAIDDNHLSDEMGKWNSQPNDRPSLLEAYVHAINLYDILGQILDREESKDSTPFRNPPDAKIDIRSLLNHDTMIMQWRESLPVYLQYELSSEDGGHGHSPTSEISDAPLDGFVAQAKRLHTRYRAPPFLLIATMLIML